jgi:hypothetical protein
MYSWSGRKPMSGITVGDYLPREEHPEFIYALKKVDMDKVANFDKRYERGAHKFEVEDCSYDDEKAEAVDDDTSYVPGM